MEMIDDRPKDELKEYRKTLKGLTGVEQNALVNLVKSAGVEPDVFDWDTVDKSLSFEEMRNSVIEQLKKLGRGMELLEKDIDKQQVKDEVDHYEQMMNELEKKEQTRLEKAMLGKIISQQSQIAEQIYNQKQLIFQEVDGWSVGTSQLTWNTLFFLMNIGRHNILNIGKQGIGKTRATKELIEWLEMPIKTHMMKGRYTPKRFYMELKEHQEDNICVDEFGWVMDNKEIWDMLKQALLGDEIGWHTSKEENLEEAFKIKGSILFNSNRWRRNEDFFALADRCYTHLIKQTNEQIIAKRKNARKWKPNMPIWALIRNRILLIRNEKVRTELTDLEKDLLDSFIEQELKKLGFGFHPETSFRVYDKAEAVFLKMKLLFGKLDTDIIEKSKEIIKNYITLEQKESVVLKIINSYKGEVSKGILYDEMMSELKISLRTAQRYLAKLLEQNIVKELNARTISI